MALKAFSKKLKEIFGAFRGASILSVFYVIFGVYMWNETFSFVEAPRIVVTYRNGFYFVSAILLVLAAYISFQYSIKKK
jgi:hypothetical protein